MAKLGVLSLVVLSVLLAPLSVAAVMSGALAGVVGTPVSMTMGRLPLDCADSLPAASVRV